MSVVCGQSESTLTTVHIRVYILILLLLLQKLLYYLSWNLCSQCHGMTKYNGMAMTILVIGYGLYLDDYDMSKRLIIIL